MKLSFLYTLLFGVAVVLFFGLAYPHHLHYQEQFQLFLFDSTYVWDIIRLPGGIADLLGRFCTQFFLFAWVGATIIGVLLSLVQLLTLRLVGWGRLYGLSFVPSLLLWLFLLDENALLGGVWAVLLTLLASWGFDKLPDGGMRRVLLLVAVPVLYWAAGPVSVVFLLLQSSHPERSLAYFAPFALLAVMLALLPRLVPVPVDRLWVGIHYHRFPTEVATMLWAATLSVVVIALLGHFSHRRDNASSSLIPHVSWVVVAICMGCLVWRNSNFKAERVMQYDFMACHQQWNRILQTISTEKPNNQIGVTVQNLALAMHGKLIDHLFDYHQNGLAGLLPDVKRDATSPLPTAEAYYQLGMIAMAQRTVFEAQEAILDFQKSGRCYKRLAQTNLICGSYEVARKYLIALRKTLFYRQWAEQTLQLLGDEQAIAKHPEYGRLRQMACKDDFFFGDHVTPDLLQNLYLSNPDNHLAYQYLMAYHLLTDNRNNYSKSPRQTSAKQ